MEKSQAKFLVPFYFFLLGLMIIFSLILLAQGMAGLDQKDDTMNNMMFIATGVVGLILTFYMIRRYQSGVQKMLRERRITVLTVEECSKCSYKAVRQFREGDYVYGYGEECPRCPKSNENSIETSRNRMLITAIYLDTGRREEHS